MGAGPTLTLSKGQTKLSLMTPCQGQWRSGLACPSEVGLASQLIFFGVTKGQPQNLSPLHSSFLPQRLKDYQRRLDLSHLRQSSDPMLSEFKVGTACLPLPVAHRAAAPGIL